MNMEIKTKERGNYTSVQGFIGKRQVISASNDNRDGKFRLDMITGIPMKPDLQTASDWLLAYTHFINIVMEMNQGTPDSLKEKREKKMDRRKCPHCGGEPIKKMGISFYCEYCEMWS